MFAETTTILNSYYIRIYVFLYMHSYIIYIYITTIHINPNMPGEIYRLDLWTLRNAVCKYLTANCTLDLCIEVCIYICMYILMHVDCQWKYIIWYILWIWAMHAIFSAIYSENIFKYWIRFVKCGLFFNIYMYNKNKITKLLKISLCRYICTYIWQKVSRVTFVLSIWYLIFQLCFSFHFLYFNDIYIDMHIHWTFSNEMIIHLHKLY